MESDGLVRRGRGGGGVDVENLQVVVWQDKFYSKKFCVICSGSLDFNGGNGISYKGDNSTLAPAFPVLSVGFISSSSACSTVGLYKSCPCRFSVGASRHPVTPAATRRHCIGLAVERLFTGRERLTLCSPFRGAARSLLASGEGRKRKETSNQTPTNTPCASTAIWQACIQITSGNGRQCHATTKLFE